MSRGQAPSGGTPGHRAHLQLLAILVGVLGKVGGVQALRPVGPVEVEQHFVVEVVLVGADDHGIVVTVETVDEGLDAGLLEVADHGGGLARLEAHHEALRADEAEGVHDDLAAHALHRVHHHGDAARVELFEALGAGHRAGERM